METTTKTHETIKESSITEDTSLVALSVIGVAATMVGIWGVTCLLSGVAQYGLIGVARGWLSSTGLM